MRALAQSVSESVAAFDAHIISMEHARGESTRLAGFQSSRGR